VRESTIRSLFDEVLRGLRIVHQHKMLHLDIKPANIFITDDDRAVMIDFGAAREADQQGTSSAPCTPRALLRPRCTGATPAWARGPTSTPWAPASTPA
jgi:serine/threonine protein kinase